MSLGGLWGLWVSTPLGYGVPEATVSPILGSVSLLQVLELQPRATACFMERYPRWTRGWVSLPGDIGPPSSNAFAIFPLQKP